MTEIMVARTSGILRAPDGTQYRITRGQTLADGRHPAVTGSPASWQPMRVELAVDDTANCPPGATGGDAEREFDELRSELAELEETADSYRRQLESVAKLLGDRGLLAGVDAEREGWLVSRLGELLAEAEPDPTLGPLADPETPEGRATIREWAWRNGHSVAESGKVPKAVIDAYRVAHGG